jgi:hypothetical protein
VKIFQPKGVNKMKQDRFLIGILVFIALLVVAALVLFFVRPGNPTYQSEDTPEGVVFNYVLAIQDNDLERAYGYLADFELKPSEPAFRQSLLNNALYNEEYSLQVGETQLLSEDEAWVMISIQYLSGGPFETGWSTQDHASLVRQGNKWKLSYMPYPYWGYDWYQATLVPEKP